MAWPVGQAGSRADAAGAAQRRLRCIPPWLVLLVLLVLLLLQVVLLVVLQVVLLVVQGCGWEQVPAGRQVAVGVST